MGLSNAERQARWRDKRDAELERLRKTATKDKARELELIDALATAHRQVDMLMAMIITMDKTFMPSKTSLWPDIVKRVELIRKYEGRL